MIQSTICIQATSLQKLAEWEMRAIQGSFPYLKDQLLFSACLANYKGFSPLIMILLIFRTCRVGLNQLSSTFYPMFHEAGDYVLDTTLLK